jgi:hypothetical protein
MQKRLFCGKKARVKNAAKNRGFWTLLGNRLKSYIIDYKYSIGDDSRKIRFPGGASFGISILQGESLGWCDRFLVDFWERFLRRFWMIVMIMVLGTAFLRAQHGTHSSDTTPPAAQPAKEKINPPKVIHPKNDGRSADRMANCFKPIRVTEIEDFTILVKCGTVQNP